MKDVSANRLADRPNIRIACKIEMNPSYAREIHLQLTVQIHEPCGFNREHRNLTVRHGGKIPPHSRNTLNVTGDHALVGKYHKVTDNGVGAKDCLAVDQQVFHMACAFAIVRLELEYGSIFKIDHENTSFLRTRTDAIANF